MPTFITHFVPCAADFELLTRRPMPTTGDSVFNLWMRFHIDDRTEECETYIVREPVVASEEYDDYYTVHLLHYDGTTVKRDIYDCSNLLTKADLLVQAVQLAHIILDTNPTVECVMVETVLKH